MNEKHNNDLPDPDAGGFVPPADEVPSLEPEIAPEAEAKAGADLGAELAQLNDKYLRLQAEYQNYRKRMAREIADARRVGVISTVEAFFPVFDQFGMAEKAAGASGNLEAIRQGIAMIARTYAGVLEELNIVQFSAVGAEFDPARHDAVAQEPSDTVPEGVVTREWSTGYMMGDKVLRPARVVVSSGAAAPEAKED